MVGMVETSEQEKDLAGNEPFLLIIRSMCRPGG